MPKTKPKDQSEKEVKQMGTDDIPILPNGTSQYDPIVDDHIKDLTIKFGCTVQEALIAIRSANKFAPPKYGHVEWSLAKISTLEFSNEGVHVAYALPILDGRYPKKGSTATLDDLPERFWEAQKALYPHISASLLPLVQVEELDDRQSKISKISLKRDSLNRRGMSMRVKIHPIDEEGKKPSVEFATPWTFNKPESDDPEADISYVHPDEVDASVRLLVAEIRSALSQKYSGIRAE